MATSPLFRGSAGSTAGVFAGGGGFQCSVAGVTGSSSGSRKPQKLSTGPSPTRKRCERSGRVSACASSCSKVWPGLPRSPASASESRRNCSSWACRSCKRARTRWRWASSSSRQGRTSPGRGAYQSRRSPSVLGCGMAKQAAVSAPRRRAMVARKGPARLNRVSPSTPRGWKSARVPLSRKGPFISRSAPVAKIREDGQMPDREPEGPGGRDGI